MKRIVYCTDSLQLAGGIGRIVTLKANWLVQKGYRVTILTTEGKEINSFYHLDPRIMVHALDINFLTIYDNKRSPWGMIKSYSDRKKKENLFYKTLKAFLAGHAADVVFTTVNYPGINRLQDGSRKIFEAHFSAGYQRCFMQMLPSVSRLAYKLHCFLKDRSLGAYDRVVLLTERDKQLRGGIRKFDVIPNFITVPTPEKMPDYSNKQAISVGRLDYPKGYDLLFKAWQQVHTIHPDWHLAIYGHSYDRKEEYQKAIDSLGLQDVIHLYDPVRDIVSKYLESSFYVMSSRYEGFPLVLPEAMTCGLPCVSFDLNCGPSDIIRHGEDGLLVHPNGDIEKLSEAICWMIEHPQKLAVMGEKAKSNIRRFAIDSVMQAWVKLIEA